MMTGVLVIGPKEKAAIDVAIREARAKPIPWSLLQEVAIDDRDNPTDRLDLADGHKPERMAEIRKEYPTRRVQLGTYDAAISFEEQPAGLFRHLSISSRLAGKIPNEHAIKLMLDAFGFSGYPLIRPYRRTARPSTSSNWSRSLRDMKIADVIAELQKYPSDMEVMVRGYEGGYEDRFEVKKERIILNYYTPAAWYYGPHDEFDPDDPDTKDMPTIDAVVLWYDRYISRK